jgi:glycosyltransferase involved in cell wall biosynthesis
MKVALVHDWLGERIGGAEQVFFELAAHYPEADLFSLTYNQKKFAPYLGLRPVTTSFLNRLPRFFKQRPTLLLPLMRRAVLGLKFKGYDLVITNSTAWVKNINVPEGTKHLSYCHSPARMLWDSWPKYLESQHIGPFKLGPVSRFLITCWASRLRLWDFYATERIDLLLGNSNYIAERIRKYYGRTASVLYPPVEQLDAASHARRSDYYLVLSVLSRYKQIDVVIEAFKASSRQLIVAGDGPDRSRLEALADGAPNIHFEGRVSALRKQELMAEARGFIFPGIEDFGITPVEAMMVGTPVIALGAGGLRETVQEGLSGHFYHAATAAALRAAIEDCDDVTWDRAKIRASAEKFSKATFLQNLDRYVDEVRSA